MQITGKESDSGEMLTLRQSSPMNNSRTPVRQYRESSDKYEQLTESVLSSEPIPLGHRQTIRRYFEMIRPQGGEGRQSKRSNRRGLGRQFELIELTQQTQSRPIQNSKISNQICQSPRSSWVVLRRFHLLLISKSNLFGPCSVTSITSVLFVLYSAGIVCWGVSESFVFL